MPGSNGFETLAALHNPVTVNIPVIILSIVELKTGGSATLPALVALG